MPTYPIDLPAGAGWVKSVRWTQKTVNSFTRNPYSGAQQVYVFGAGWWEIDVLLKPMRRDNAADWMSYLKSLHGKEGTFNFVDPVASTPRGTWGGTPVIWKPAAPQYFTGTFIQIGVYAANQANIARVGDFLTITNAPGFYQVTASSVNADASGVVNLEVWPPVRAPVYHGWPVVYGAQAKGVFRLKDDVVEQWDENKMQMSISFSGVEAF